MEDLLYILISLMIGLGMFFVLFLVLRELFCWYWKINEMVKLLSEIRDHFLNLRKKSAT